ncbi:MAG: zonular occludens toxin domain-containing protein, partial [Rectinemataceae bacterium]|nr:zonular occludens toxin domain-containing protein [Rectinemataceae bacterium]
GKKPEDARPIFVLGIPDLTLPHALLPLKSVQVAKAGAPMLVPDWDEMPDGSLVIIDEAQGCFPPRSSASTAPAHVAWLNTHRHHGFDIWITTQHPKLVDVSLRALVGRHQHFRRMFGMSRAVIYEWDACSDSLAGLANAVTTYWSYPKKIFALYKSAEIHTKQSFKLPKWLLVFPIGIALAAFFVPRSVHMVSSAIAGKGLNGGSSEVSQSSSVAPGVSPLRISGYVLQGLKCYAFLKDGSMIDEPNKCRENVK